MTTTAVKWRPILFSGPMVRAILDGQKTQTRRTIKPQPTKPLEAHVLFSTEAKNTGSWKFATDEYDPRPEHIHCPYGHPGDRLWVRETWASTEQAGEGSPWVVYRADDPDWGTMTGWKWQPSIFMRLKDCRIKLEITGVRAERLKDISEDDAKAEGCDGGCPVGSIPAYLKWPHSYHYAQLWDQINGPGAWDLNPWVWVVEFKRLDAAHA